MAMITPDKWRDFWKYYVGGVKQIEGIDALYEAMPKSLLEDDTTWIDLFRTPDPVKERSDEIPTAAIDLICEFEGFRAEVYDDGVGVATIGFGSTFYEDYEDVAWGDPPITRERARKLMLLVCADFWDGLERSIPFWSEMTSGQRGCLLSFAYNCGKSFYASNGFATITNVLSSRAYGDMDYALHLYVNPGSPVETGLRRRRDAEYALWIS